MTIGAAAEPGEADPHWTRRHVIISALGITQILAWGSSYYLLAVLAAPISRATGWSSGFVVAGFSVGLLVSGLISVRVGRLIDDHGGRPVLAGSAVCLAAGLALLAAAPNLVVYLCAWLVIGAGMGTGLYDAAFSTLGRLYGARGRSAITMLTLWGGFASTVCWPVTAALVEAVGWRGTCLVFAGIQLGIALPIHWLVLPAETPRRARAKPADDASPPRPAPDGARLRRLLLLGAIVTTAGVISATWSVHLITILQSQGLTLAAAVGLGALVGPAQVGARIVEMLGGGRHHPIWTLAAATLLIGAGLALLAAGFAIPAIALLAYGAGNGIFSIARGTLPLALFGPAGYARLMGRIAMPSLIAQALAPSLAALLMVRFGAHATLVTLTALACANVAAVALLWLSARRSLRA
ncbi:MFS transporter [Acuticoccus sp. M5D2P5]|uniref:MFS transporter n=1 Tax=Acuticoccus kalidii TaxID=2910977 RepID=UPI001F41AB93|nr:MFS transporter [Acuticoccus kalidii]MCF3936247.1 MFS transporter [Acuticoccus kalidii]